MSNGNDIIQRLHAALPEVRMWIDEFLGEHAEQAREVSTLGFTQLATCFPQEFLERTKVVIVPRVQYPPIDSMGLPEFAYLQQMPFEGITFKDTIFLQQDKASESLHFHELVHVVQWARLGIDNFLLAYGVGLSQFGYDQSPLEKMARTLQGSFDDGQPPQELVHLIETCTDEIWTQVAPVVQAGGSGT